MSALDTRIELLYTSGMISDNTVGRIRLLRRLFLQMYGIELTEENAAACVTHLCMAYQRAEHNETIAPLDPLVREEIYAEDDYETACRMADAVLRFVAPLPPNEYDYILMHIVMLLKNVRAEYDARILK